VNLKKIREQRKLYEAAERAFAKAEAILDKITAVDTKPREPGWHEKGETVTFYQTVGNGGMTMHRRICIEAGNPGKWKDLAGVTEWGSA
jgi:hypothetical protein